MSINKLTVRPYEAEDVPKVHKLMLELAEFEGYADQFAVTEKDLIDNITAPRSPYHILVAQMEAEVVGILTFYFLPFTYDMKPWLYIKELYVEAQFRKAGCGMALMQAIQDIAKQNHCSRITWQVLANNHNAQRFYQSLGGKHEKQWQSYVLHQSI